MDNTTDLYNYLVDMGLKFLLFWNMVNCKFCHLCLLMPFDITYIIFIFILLLEFCNCHILNNIVIIKDTNLNPNPMDIFMDNFYIKFVACKF
ncbi:hypothetical protein F5888DRAFT_1709112 [Russula emetica]|nr:hypothetical protein F5888DRAFT_1709112 [Russula emetica]